MGKARPLPKRTLRSNKKFNVEVTIMQYIIDSDKLDVKQLEDFMISLSKLIFECHRQNAEAEQNERSTALLNQAVNETRKGGAQ